MNKLQLIKALLDSDCATDESDDFPFKVGDAVLIQTVTFYFTGRIVKITPKWVHLAESAWVADMGRYAQAIEGGKLKEVEAINAKQAVPIASIVNVVAWNHPLPRETK
jgi:hypothetical protein